MTHTSRAIIAALACVLPLAGARAQQKVYVGHPTTPTVSVRLFAPAGDLKVIGWDRDSVEMTGVVPKGSRVESSAGAPAKASAGLKMFVEVTDETTARDAKLVLRVPRGARVWLKTGSADVDISGVTGGVDVNVVGGSITVAGDLRELRAESMDGSVTITGSPEWMRVKTATGDITIRGGQDVGASTISGTIRCAGGEVERAKLETTTGTISLGSALARNASVELETHSGPIDVQLPYKTDLEVDAATITGAIDNLWTKARAATGREGRGMTLSTSTGAGGARIVIRSFKGTVQLRGK